MKATPPKPGHVEVPIGFLQGLRTLLAQNYIKAEDRNHAQQRLTAFIEGGWDFEVQPTKIGINREPFVCDEADATQWSVYRRHRVTDNSGQRLVEWVANCAERTVAESLRQALQHQHDNRKGV